MEIQENAEFIYASQSAEQLKSMNFEELNTDYYNRQRTLIHSSQALENYGKSKEFSILESFPLLIESNLTSIDKYETILTKSMSKKVIIV